ncbi:hypothetical protein VTI74DRAFT_1788 [Chaetomium olivicolor]
MAPCQINTKKLASIVDIHLVVDICDTPTFVLSPAGICDRGTHEKRHAPDPSLHVTARLSPTRSGNLSCLLRDCGAKPSADSRRASAPVRLVLPSCRSGQIGASACISPEEAGEGSVIWRGIQRHIRAPSQETTLTCLFQGRARALCQGGRLINTRDERAQQEWVVFREERPKP